MVADEWPFGDFHIISSAVKPPPANVTLQLFKIIVDPVWGTYDNPGPRKLPLYEQAEVHSESVTGEIGTSAESLASGMMKGISSGFNLRKVGLESLPYA